MEELQSFIQQYEDATNTHDFSEVAKLIKTDAIYFFSDGTFRGLAEIKKAFERNWNTIQDEVYQIKDIEWISFTERSATCVYHFYWSGYFQGEKRTGMGRGTNVLEKINGQWFIIHEHLSSVK
ncbi:DUF4440 domain-containing protein [Thermoflavimicrobium daqui]|uniref:DUF4440 domain-containing protein n=2 Tax=Thermoflavimicrobium daqui TaxID=2137476 RepID=A0A364K4S3_9BACL|nr:DUF4440 domain-containing protein [Thermoflavimicrobium daqui]